MHFMPVLRRFSPSEIYGEEEERHGRGSTMNSSSTGGFEFIMEGRRMDRLIPFPRMNLDGPAVSQLGRRDRPMLFAGICHQGRMRRSSPHDVRRPGRACFSPRGD